MARNDNCAHNPNVFFVLVSAIYTIAQWWESNRFVLIANRVSTMTENQ